MIPNSQNKQTTRAEPSRAQRDSACHYRTWKDWWRQMRSQFFLMFFFLARREEQCVCFASSTISLVSSSSNKSGESWEKERERPRGPNIESWDEPLHAKNHTTGYWESRRQSLGNRMQSQGHWIIHSIIRRESVAQMLCKMQTLPTDMINPKSKAKRPLHIFVRKLRRYCRVSHLVFSDDTKK